MTHARQLPQCCGKGLHKNVECHGEVDYLPWKVGPKWLFCASPTYMHSQIGDSFNRSYSGFTYLSEDFRMQSRLQQSDLSPSTFCALHLLGKERMKIPLITTFRLCVCRLIALQNQTNAID